MFDSAKEAALRRAVQNSGVLDGVLKIISGIEVELLAEVKALEDAAGVEHIDRVPEHEERKDALREFVDAKLARDVESYYVEEVLATTMDNPEDARPYLGMNGEEWREQIEEWADIYRSKGAGGDRTPGEIADHHVRRKFGVDIETFEQAVVEYRERDLLERVLAGNFHTATEGVRLVREEIREEQ